MSTDSGREGAGSAGGSDAPGPSGGARSAADAVRNAHAWFELNSGWAPPDEDWLAEWISDGVCRCPDDCVVEPEGWCSHGLASWWLILGALDEGP